MRAPTRLMHLANISYYPLMKYLDFLSGKGLVRKIGPSNLSLHPRSRRDRRSKFQIEITSKGRKVLKSVRSSEIDSLFGYPQWLRDEKRKSE